MRVLHVAEVCDSVNVNFVRIKDTGDGWGSWVSCLDGLVTDWPLIGQFYVLRLCG